MDHQSSTPAGSSLERIWSEEKAASNVDNDAFGPTSTHHVHPLHAIAIDSSGSLHACFHHHVEFHQEVYTNISTHKFGRETGHQLPTTQAGMT